MDFSDSGKTSNEPQPESLSSVGNCLYGKRRLNAGSIVLNVILVIIGFLIVCEIIFNSMYTGLYVVHGSMTPTLTGAPSVNEAGGDYIYINERATPAYGDIVVVFDQKKNTNIIKRVVAFGGDSVKIVEGKLFLKKSGQTEFLQVDESYVSPLYNVEGVNVNALYYNYPADGSGEHVVAANSYFLLGDNRNDSSDSRDSDNGENGDYHKKFLVGVVPWWSVKFKHVSTAWHTFFNFTLRGKSAIITEEL